MVTHHTQRGQAPSPAQVADRALTVCVHTHNVHMNSILMVEAMFKSLDAKIPADVSQPLIDGLRESIKKLEELTLSGRPKQ